MPAERPTEGSETRYKYFMSRQLERSASYLMAPAHSGYTRMFHAFWAQAVVINVLLTPISFGLLLYLTFIHDPRMVEAFLATVILYSMGGTVAYIAAKMQGAEWYKMRCGGRVEEF